MSWTQLQIYNTGKTILTDKYMFGAGTEYRILFGQDNSLEILIPSNKKFSTVSVRHFRVSHKDFATHIAETLLVEKPQVLAAGFSFVDGTLNTFTKEFILDLIQDHLHIIPQNPSGVM